MSGPRRWTRRGDWRSYRRTQLHEQRREAAREEMYRLIRLVFSTDPDMLAEREAARTKIRAGRKRAVARAKAQRRKMQKAATVAIKARAVDTLRLLLQQGHIDRRHYAAAEIYRDAWLRSHGATGSSMDFNRQRGIGTTSAPLPPSLSAAALLNDARQYLGKLDAQIVLHVVVEGLTVQQAAQRLFGGKMEGSRSAPAVGQRFRLALDQLADRWIPKGRGFARGTRSEDTGTGPNVAGVVQRGPVAHASAHRTTIDRSRTGPLEPGSRHG